MQNGARTLDRARFGSTTLSPAPSVSSRRRSRRGPRAPGTRINPSDRESDRLPPSDDVLAVRYTHPPSPDILPPDPARNASRGLISTATSPRLPAFGFFTITFATCVRDFLHPGEGDPVAPFSSLRILRSRGLAYLSLSTCLSVPLSLFRRPSPTLPFRPLRVAVLRRD